MIKEYGRVEEQQKVAALIEVLDARTKLKLFDADNEIIFIGYAYQLYESNNYKDFVIDYIKFISIGKEVICVIKNNK